MEKDEDGNETNREQYKKLIHKLLENEKSRLISVDPSNSSKAIRATCEFTTLQELYLGANGLDLKLHDTKVAGDDMVVDCKIWKLKGRTAE